MAIPVPASKSGFRSRRPCGSAWSAISPRCATLSPRSTAPRSSTPTACSANPASGPKCPRVGETDAVIDASDRAREAFERGAWGDVCAQLFAADAEDPLGLEDLERLAVAAYLVGRDEDSVEVWTRAHQVRPVG